MLERPPKRLFKYASFDRLDVLQGQLIRFTQPEAFNDPFEMSPHMTGLVSDQEMNEYLISNFEVIIKTEYDSNPGYRDAGLCYEDFSKLARLRKHELFRSLQSTAPLIQAVSKRAPEKVRNLICVLCLSESPVDLLMWSHYGDEHKGMVIEFDTSHSVFHQRKAESDEFRHLRRVVYRDSRPSITLVETNANTFLLTKGSIWAYEREWRIVAAREHARTVVPGKPHDIFLFPMPSEAIVAVRIGARASESDEKRLRELVATEHHLRHINIVRYKLHSSRFELVE